MLNILCVVLPNDSQSPLSKSNSSQLKNMSLPLYWYEPSSQNPSPIQFSGPHIPLQSISGPENDEVQTAVVSDSQLALSER